MFGYYKTIRNFKAACGSFPMPNNTVHNENVVEIKSGIHAKTFFRTAACFVLAAVLVLTCSSNLPMLQSKLTSTGGTAPKTSASSAKISHDFELMVYAAQAPDGLSSDSKKYTVLKDNINVQLPNSSIEYSKCDYNEDGYLVYGYGFEYGQYTIDNYGNYSNSFLFDGNNISSVTYAALNGTFQYSNEAYDEKYKEKCPTPKFVCSFTIPSSKMPGKDETEWWPELLKMWNSGELDNYKVKYFDGKDVDLNHYNVCIEKDIDNNLMTVTIYTRPATDLQPYMEGKSVTTMSNPQYEYIQWYLSPEELTILENDAKAQRPTPMDYSTLPGDTITVTAKFTDGSTLTKHIDLSFNKDGNLCAKLIDN